MRFAVCDLASCLSAIYIYIFSFDWFAINKILCTNNNETSYLLNLLKSDIRFLNPSPNKVSCQNDNKIKHEILEIE